MAVICVVYGYHESVDNIRLWRRLSELKADMGDPIIIMCFV